MKLDEVFESQLLREAHLDGVGRLVAGAVVVRKGRVLLLRRRYDDFMGGFYELPSGVAEAGETLGQALYREVEEETGLLVEDISAYLGCFSYLSGSETRTRQFNFLVTVADFFLHQPDRARRLYLGLPCRPGALAHHGGGSENPGAPCVEGTHARESSIR